MGQLRAGVGVAVITPPPGIEMGAWVLRTGLAEGIHDEMCVRALVLDDGKTPVAIVSLDVACLSADMTEKIRDLVSSHIPLPRNHLLLVCSHTHTSPYTYLAGFEQDMALSAGHRAYLETFPHYVAGAVIEAWHHRQPASLGSAVTEVAGITINRRDPTLPVDPFLGVMRVDDADGRPLACLVNYACHGTAVGAHYLEWTADFPGYLARTIEEAEPGCTCLFLQGAEGDIHPWDWYFGNPNPLFGDHYEAAERLGKAIAGPALGLLHRIETTPEVVIRFQNRTISVPPRPISWNAEEAERHLADVEASTPPYTHPTIPNGCPGCLSAQTYPGPYRLVGARHEAEFARHYPQSIAVELNALRANDTIVVTNSGELFSELGMEIRRRSPFPDTFVVSLTNGSIGYLPTREAAEAVLGLSLSEFTDPVKHRRHYGATITTEVGPAAGEIVVQETLRMIEGLIE